jgi:DNA repair photolyase
MAKKTGTKEWAPFSMNFQRGCEHGCRYCYARYDAVKRFKTCEARHWPIPCINNAKIDHPNKKKYPGRVMFPTTHDITPANISQYMCLLRKLLDAGNNVLIVSKPHWDCITVICEAFKQYKEQITFRFTIGSINYDILKFWEPGAPAFTERRACLQYAYSKGYNTSISCEPYLDNFVADTYTACKDWITDSFWIGMIRHFKSRVDLDGVSPYTAARFVDPLVRAMSDSVVKGIYSALKDEPLIKWKDSIQKVIE